MQQPQTRNEWQHAANLAHALLLIDASEAYGLTTGGPDINTDRCDDILHRAEALGITPTDELIEPLLAELT